MMPKFDPRGPVKRLRWMASTKEDLSASPAPVKAGIGYALYEVQCGERPTSAKPLRGFGGAGVLEIVEDYDGNTWRAVYTVEVAEAVYVLHFFQKKSKRGISTPRPIIELIKRRRRQALAHRRDKSK